jgi:glycyl-tRNA synthetase beta chain
VGEFPELQGVMGRIYARLDGEPEEVATAIYEHYLPRGAGDDLPTTPAGRWVGLADRLDTLAGGFAVGKSPTGSSDPYALRRAALGVIRIVVGHGLSLSLRDALETALAGYAEHADRAPELLAQLMDFVRARLKAELVKDRGHPAEVVEAVLLAGFGDLLDATRRVEALSALRQAGDLVEQLEPFKRCLRISADSDGLPDVNPELFESPAERELWHTLAGGRADVEGAFEEGRYVDVLAFLTVLKPHVARLFDDVMVMAEDPALRANRLALCRSVASLFAGVADFSQIGA